MSSDFGDAHKEINGRNGITRSFSDGDAFKTQNYVLLKRPNSITGIFRTWSHRERGEVRTSSTFKPKSYETKWRYVLSQRFLEVLRLIQPLLAFIGTCVELPGNVWHANGGSLWQVTKKLLTFEIVRPRKDSAKYHSLIFQLDPRTKLWEDKSAEGTPRSEAATKTAFPGNDAGARSTADVLVMASKLAYENEAVIAKVVTEDWNMHFEGFYNCWNELLNQNNTQVFLFTDKPHDANGIVVAWRGTEPFNAMDWSTDFDFSWYPLEGMGNVHVGFLEALGLCNRNSEQSLQHLQNKHKAKAEVTKQDTPSSGLPQDVINNANKYLAYDHVTKRVKELLHKHPGAKVYITGHSLGGALAALYAGMLHYYYETTITKQLAAVYTFGQPRIGDRGLKNYMEAKLKEKYFRVVYCNDLVPRIPFDDPIFEFKHFGYCFYYNSRYKSKCLEDEPRKNFFYLSDMLTIHLTAILELYNACRLGDPEFVESWSSLFARVMALFVPGIGGHSPVNYVNAIRLGPAPLVAELTAEIREIDQRLHEWEEKARGFVYRLYSKCLRRS